MGSAIAIGLRDQLISLKQQGHTLQQISQRLELPLGTVSNLSARYKQQGHLAVGYARCGPKQARSEALFHRASLWLKRLHPRWGAGLIRLQLGQRYGAQSAPAVRTLQRWFRRAGLSKPRQQPRPPGIGQSRAVHNIWQVDAKENLRLPDGTGACYLTITDEHSGAGLAALVFPPRPHQPGVRRAGWPAPD